MNISQLDYNSRYYSKIIVYSNKRVYCSWSSVEILHRLFANGAITAVSIFTLFSQTGLFSHDRSTL